MAQHLHHPACASVASWSTPRASAGCTAAGSRPLQVVALIAAGLFALGSGDGRHRRRRRALVDPAGALERLRLLDPGAVHVIDFRYHIVSIVAIFFALGAGVVLGAGPLKGTAQRHRPEPGRPGPAALADARQELIRGQVAGQVPRRLRRQGDRRADRRQADRQEDRRRARCRTPTDDLANTLTEELSRRPAVRSPPGSSLDSKLFDPGQRQLVEPLVTELVTADIDVPRGQYDVPAGRTDPGRAGSPPAKRARPLDSESTKIISGLTGSKLLSLKPTPKGPGQPGRRGGREAADTGAGQLVVQRRGGLHRGARPGQRRRRWSPVRRRRRRTAAC